MGQPDRVRRPVGGVRLSSEEEPERGQPACQQDPLERTPTGRTARRARNSTRRWR
ncbi:hypothetical protein [Streptomyces sp. NPDC005548]|uniref:hypothetical protein n=1 Tax=unclassified Streptomyces TaxID=2593676 RepID=UPI0036D02794